MTTDHFLERISKDRARKIVYVHVEEPQIPELGSPVEDLPVADVIKSSLKSLGISRLYRFQEEAIKKIMSGKDTLILAGTGMGKTEAFLIPILNEVSKNPFSGVLALLIYPTKALARDQLKRIMRLTSNIFGARVAVLDGDTPERDRKKIYSNPPPILITNPDMIHVSLQLSEDFKHLVSTARYVVLDDVHVYNGVLGSHVAYVLRRLNRILKYEPVFIGSSATIGNPREFAQKFFGKSVEVVKAGESKKSRVVHVLVKPTGRSKYIEALSLLRASLKEDKKTLIFADSHRAVESLKRYADRYKIPLKVHRAGLPPKKRARIEELFRKGILKALAATPTLEIGIDIGDLDVVILLNIPPTYTRYIQRTGRCGRRGQEAYVFTILSEDPISNYYEGNPEEFFKREYDPMAIDLTNEEILKVHLLAMARDRPYKISELTPFEKKVLAKLAVEGLVRVNTYVKPTRKGLKYLRKRMSLRGTGDIVEIVDENTGKVIGARELPMALRELHPGAIYMHGGNLYRVKKYERNRAFVEKLPHEIDVTTYPLYYSDPSEEKVLEERTAYGIPVSYGSLSVRQVVWGYVEKNFFTGELLGEMPLDKEISYVFKSKGLLLWIPPNPAWNIFQNAEAFHAIEHALITAAELLVGASPTDLAGISFPSGHIYIYDSHAGGSGISYLLYQRLEEAFKRAHYLVSSCKCEDGCPRCIYSPYCGNNNKILSRKRAKYVLDNVIFKKKIIAVLQEKYGKPIV